MRWKPMLSTVLCWAILVAICAFLRIQKFCANPKPDDYETLWDFQLFCFFFSGTFWLLPALLGMALTIESWAFRAKPVHRDRNPAIS